MGMAASQARLLGITARLHDVEGRAQRIQAQKVALAMDQDNVYKTYCAALDETKIQVAYTTDDGSFNYIDGCYDSVCKYKEGRVRQYALQNSQTGNIMLDRDTIKILEQYDNGETCGINNSDYMTYYNNMIAAQKALADAEAELAEKYADNKPEEIERTKPETNDELQGYNITCSATIYDESGESQNESLTYYHPLDEFNAKKSTEDAESQFKTYLYKKYGVTTYDTNGTGEPSPVYKQVTTYTPYMEHNTAWDVWQEQLLALQEHRNKCKEEAKAAEDAFNNFLASDPEYTYYKNLWELKEEYGYEEMKSQYIEGESGYNWFNNMIEAGLMIIKEYIPTGTNKGWSDTDVTTSVNQNYLQQVEDTKAVQKAEAEYEHALNLINAKDKKYDNELSKLETEEKSLTTEIESIEKVRDDNEERTFGIFG